MANLRVDKITSTETFETTGSVQFDGDGDYLRLDDHADLEFGSGDFTVECFIYPTGVPQGTWACIFSKGFPLQSYFMNTNSISLYASTTASGSYDIIENANITGTNSVPRDRWTHYAVCRSGDIWKVFIDGIEKYSALHPGTIADTGSSFGIGDYAPSPGTYEFQGHISNFRVLKGKALYTENFKVPMRELEVTPETVLLACQSKTDASHEKTGRAIEVNGNAVANELTPGILTPVPKSGGNSAITGSVEFDGTGDYLQTTSSDYALGTDDFTVEFWVNYSTKSVPGTPVILDDESTTYAPLIGYPSGSPGNAVLYMSSSGSSWDISSGTFFGTITGNSWVHLALTRKGSTFYLFYNGVLANTISSSASVYQSANTITAGYAQANTYFQGFISNLCVVKGTALYTDNFIPPTRELKKIPGTVLLCCQDPDNPLTEATGKTITGYGDLHEAADVEMLTNGSFAGGYSTEWEAKNNANLSHSNGELTVTSTQNYSGVRVKSAYLPSLVAGRKYVMTIDLKSITNPIRFGVVSGLTVSNISTAGRHSGVFTASAVTEIYIEKPDGSNSTFVLKSVSIRELNTPNKASNFTPQVGDDRKVTLEGVTKINTENYFYLPTGDTVTRDSRYGRAVFGGGRTSPSFVSNIICFANIATTGNAQDFGDLTYVARGVGSCSSSTRGIFLGGAGPALQTEIDFVTISTTGNAQVFSTLGTAKRNFEGFSNQTRGVFGAGQQPGSFPAALTSEMEYLTIASTGSAIEFGNLSRDTCFLIPAASSTRGIFAGGYDGPSPANGVDTMEFITIASTGNAVDFGNLFTGRYSGGGASSETRAVFAGGADGPLAGDMKDVMDYVTISSKGNAIDFGNLIGVNENIRGTSNKIRGLFAGGYGPNTTNVIQYITISSTGDAKDFGDLTSELCQNGQCSDSHGGLG